MLHHKILPPEIEQILAWRLSHQLEIDAALLNLAQTESGVYGKKNLTNR